jgi:glutamate carboxypeptidase
LIARFDGLTGHPILLLGHTDTVFSSGEAARRPFKLQDFVARGPGVFDMKGGIVLMWSALRALKAAGPLPRPVTVLLTGDEEVGSTTSRELIQREALRAAAALVLEPSLPGGALKTARKGVGRFTIKAIGKPAHAGVDPEKGVNAIEEIAAQILRLQRMSDSAQGITVTVGVVRGGTRPNVVPAEAAAEVDVRVSTNDAAAQVARTILSLRPAVSGARLEVRGGIHRPPMERTADTVRLFELACAIAKSLGSPLAEGATGGGSDGNFTAALGVPTLDGLGPVGGGAHTEDEFIEIDSLPVRAALVAGLIRHL